MTVFVLHLLFPIFQPVIHNIPLRLSPTNDSFSNNHYGITTLIRPVILYRFKTWILVRN